MEHLHRPKRKDFQFQNDFLKTLENLGAAVTINLPFHGRILFASNKLSAKIIDFVYPSISICI
jgi:hypothetical protein